MDLSERETHLQTLVPVRRPTSRVLSRANPEIDLVLSDIVMPGGMSGVELGREVRHHYPNIPVVLTSGYSHVLAEEGRHGFEVLHKPYAVEDVSRVLRSKRQP